MSPTIYLADFEQFPHRNAKIDRSFFEFHTWMEYLGP